METVNLLDDLKTRYMTFQKTNGHTDSAMRRHQATLKLHRRFLTDGKHKLGSQSITTERIKEFYVWLRETPVKERRGSIVRSIHCVHGAFKDMRAFTRFLLGEGLIETVAKVPMPKLPQTLFPLLTQAEMERGWTSKYLTGNSGLAVRNRALVGLMVDSALTRRSGEFRTHRP